MTRVRFAVVLAVVAGLAVLGTAALAVTTYLRDDGSEAGRPARLLVTDATSGATLRLPAGDWSLRGAGRRISYGDAHLDGPAVLDEGYCRARPEGSFRAVVGFTDQTFDVWRAAVTGGSPTISTGTSTEDVVLADGTPATYRWTGLMGSGGACAASGIELAMVRAGDVRAVLVADSRDEGTLSHGDVRQILLALELP